MNMSKEEKVKLVKECIDSRDNLFNSFGELEKLVGSFCDNSPLWKSLCDVDNTMQEAVSIVIGDTKMSDNATWLNWFIYDNECGKNGYNASVGGVDKEIWTIEDLIDLIDRDNQINSK